MFAYRVVAWDPDIEDRTAPQNITYFLDKTNDFADHFSIDNQGYFRLVLLLGREGTLSFLFYLFPKFFFNIFLFIGSSI